MTKADYINKHLQAAKKVESIYKVPSIFVLAQSALETGWGSNTPGNMFFGIKAGAGYTGKKQLIKTTEYHTTKTVKYPIVHSIETVKPGLYKYTVSDYFRAYNSPADSFADYGKLLANSQTYAPAFKQKTLSSFVSEITKHYSTSPTAYNNIMSLMGDIKAILQTPGNPNNEGLILAGLATALLITIVL
jgi:flagellum-specific peptidoglycan hydrolase FlgJ